MLTLMMMDSKLVVWQKILVPCSFFELKLICCDKPQRCPIMCSVEQVEGVSGHAKIFLSFEKTYSSEVHDRSSQIRL